MKMRDDVCGLIGHTPVVRLCHTVPSGSADVYVKLEWFNPGGSVKDRIALSMIEHAEATGKLKPGDIIIEPTSGNAGIGLAMVAAAKGYRALLVMPDTMSSERRSLLTAYGADLVLTPGVEGMRGAIAKAEEIVENAPDRYFMPQQFNNLDNVSAHREGTGPEIVAQMRGELDAFVCAVGTGGTISGVGQVLRKEIPDCRIVAIEPSTSSVLSGGTAGPHKIQGIGAGFVPAILDRNVIDQIITVNDADAFQMARQIAKDEGLLVGISSGAAIYAALAVAAELGAGKKVLTISPSNGERYLSTALFQKDAQTSGESRNG